MTTDGAAGFGEELRETVQMNLRIPWEPIQRYAEKYLAQEWDAKKCIRWVKAAQPAILNLCEQTIQDGLLEHLFSKAAARARKQGAGPSIHLPWEAEGDLPS